ncbi:MAG: hypothetical protein NTV58_10830 [Deltaproteobacteria bacterium]|nr:hypothetical protein [Deltaproteobacteria bacterium]
MYMCDADKEMYAPEVTDELLMIARKELKPVRKIEVPVYEFVMGENRVSGNK